APAILYSLTAMRRAQGALHSKRTAGEFNGDQVSLTGILSVTPRQSGAALGGVVVRQGRQSNVAKYATYVPQSGPWAISGDYVAEAENAAGNDACAGRRDDDFAAGHLRRGWRPGWFPSRFPWPVEPVGFGHERSELKHWRRPPWTLPKLAEPSFGGGNRQAKFIAEQDKPGLDAQHVQSDKTCRSRMISQDLPQPIGRLLGTDDFESGLAAIAKPADPARNLVQHCLGETEIGQRLDVRHRAEMPQRFERGGTLDGEGGAIGWCGDGHAGA